MVLHNNLTLDFILLLKCSSNKQFTSNIHSKKTVLFIFTTLKLIFLLITRYQFVHIQSGVSSGWVFLKIIEYLYFFQNPVSERNQAFSLGWLERNYFFCFKRYSISTFLYFVTLESGIFFILLFKGKTSYDFVSVLLQE